MLPGGHAGLIRSRDDRVGAVAQLKLHIERRAGGDRIGIQRQIPAGARVEGGIIQITGALDDSRTAEGGIGSQRICCGGGVANGIGAIAKAVVGTGNDRHVILGRGGRAGRSSQPPQAARRGIAVAHDRGGGGSAGVVFVGQRATRPRSLVLKAEGVAGFVSRCFGAIFGCARRKIVGEDE